MHSQLADAKEEDTTGKTKVIAARYELFVISKVLNLFIKIVFKYYAVKIWIIIEKKIFILLFLSFINLSVGFVHNYDKGKRLLQLADVC